MKTSIHRQITANVIPGGGWEKVKCCDDGDEEEIDPEEIIIDANADQDDVFCGQFHNEYHFDACAIAQGLAYVNERKRVIRQWDELVPPCCGCEAMEGALEAFGQLLHAIQDFYSHTTWVEQHLQDNGHTLWDTDAGLPTNTSSGNLWWTPTKGPAGGPSHGDVNKDDNDSSQGKKKVQTGPHATKTYHQLAREYAQAATAVEFQKFRAIAVNTTQCIEQPLTHPCAPCEKEFHAAVRERRFAVVLPETGIASRLKLDPMIALDTAANAMMEGTAVPAGVHAAVANVDFHELEELGTTLLHVLGQLGDAHTPAHALYVARAIVALEGMRRVDSARTASFVRTRYGDELDTWGRGALLSTGLRIKSKAMARFFVERLTDVSPIGRDSYAYDYAMRYLTSYFRDGKVRFDPSDPETRIELQGHWTKHLNY